MFKKNFKGIMSTVLIVCFSFFSYKKINAMKIGYSRGNFCNVADYNKDYEKIFNGYLCYFKEKLEYKTKEIKPNDKYRLKIPDEIYDMDLNIFSDFLKSVDIFDTIHITKKEYKLLFDKVKKIKENRIQVIYQTDLEHKKNRITINLDIFNKSIKKVMSEVKTEKDKLFLFYVYFYELFKIFKSNFFEIFRISNLNTKKAEDCVNNLESTPNVEDKENIKKNFYDKLEIKQGKKSSKFQIKIDDNSAFRLERRGYDDCNGLDMCIKNMLKCLKLLDETYEELLKFKNNVKDNTLFDLKFVKNRRIIKNLNIKCEKSVKVKENDRKKNLNIKCERNVKVKENDRNELEYVIIFEKINDWSFELRVGFDLTDGIKDAEELFNPKNTVENLTKYLKEIIESSNFKKGNNYSYCKNFIDNLNKKDIFSSSVLDNIKKEIELRKELMQIIKEIIRKDIYKNIVNKIMG